MNAKRSHPKPMRGIIDQLMKKWSSQAVQQEEVFTMAWRDTVGEKLAQHSRPARVIGRKLLVFVESAAWMNELTYLKEKIIIQVKIAFSKKGIELDDVVFKLGPMKKSTES